MTAGAEARSPAEAEARIVELERLLAQRDARIRELEVEVAVLKHRQWLKEGCAGAGDFD